MNKNQLGLHWREWGKTRAALRAHGWAPKAADAKRKEIYAQAGAFYLPKHRNAGQVKSCPDLTNKEFTNVLGYFWAWSQADNLDAQLRQVAQTRLDFAGAMLAACGVEPHGRAAYVDSIAKRIHRKPTDELTDLEWADVVGALNHTRMHKLGIAHSHHKAAPAGEATQAETGAEDPDLPFDDRTAAPATVDEDNPY